MQASHDFVNPVTEDVMKVQGDHFYQILFGGDQLTAARARGSQRVRMNSDSGLSRFEGLISVIEDWHAKVILLQVTFSVCVCTIIMFLCSNVCANVHGVHIVCVCVSLSLCVCTHIMCALFAVA